MTELVTITYQGTEMQVPKTQAAMLENLDRKRERQEREKKMPDGLRKALDHFQRFDTTHRKNFLDNEELDFEIQEKDQATFDHVEKMLAPVQEIIDGYLSMVRPD